jgi:hypothetical protein
MATATKEKPGTPTAKTAPKSKQQAPPKAAIKVGFKTYLDTPVALEAQQLSHAANQECLPLLKAFLAKIPEKRNAAGKACKQSIPFISIGVNSVARSLERAVVALVIILPEQNPLLVSHLLSLCAARKVPCLVSKPLIDAVSSTSKVRRITSMAFLNEPTDAALATFLATLSKHLPTAAIPAAPTSSDYAPERVKRLKMTPKEPKEPAS